MTSRTTGLTDEPRATTPATEYLPIAKMRLQISACEPFCAVPSEAGSMIPRPAARRAPPMNSRHAPYPTIRQPTGMNTEYRYSPVWSSATTSAQKATNIKVMCKAMPTSATWLKCGASSWARAGYRHRTASPMHKGSSKNPSNGSSRCQVVTPACGTCSTVSIHGSTSGINGIVTNSKIRDMVDAYATSPRPSLVNMATNGAPATTESSANAIVACAAKPNACSVSPVSRGTRTKLAMSTPMVGSALPFSGATADRSVVVNPAASAAKTTKASPNVTINTISVFDMARPL